MATSVIKSTGGYTTGEITCPITGATLKRNTCWRDGNVVNFSFAASNIDVTAGTVMGHLPEGFRPAKTYAYGIAIGVVDNVTSPIAVAVYRNGNIATAETSTKRITHIDIGMSYGTH